MTPSSDRREPEHGSSLDAAQLDGYTVEQLSDYLDRGRVPRDESIETSSAAQNALAALSRLRSVAPRILEAEAEVRDVSDDSWIQRILEQIAVQAHAGRDIPIHHDSPDAILSVSEGAVRALVREAGDEIEGLIVERTALQGDIETPGSPVTVSVRVSLFDGSDEDQVVAAFRAGVLRAIGKHTELVVTKVSVRVHEKNLDSNEEPNDE